MVKGIKMTLFILLMGLLWLPVFQEFTKYFKEPELKGAFVKPYKPGISIDSIRSMEFQKQFESCQNSNFGYRAFFVKVKNSLDYLLFKELSIDDNIAGKDGFIFSKGSTERTVGILYNGKENNISTIEKIKFMYDGLQNKGVHLFAVIAPSKESIIPEFLPTPYNGKIKEPNDYTDFIQGFSEYNIPYIDFCSYFKQLKDTSEYPLFTKTGFHWSMYSASYAQDYLLDYIEHTFSKQIPKYTRIGIEVSDTAREPDADFEGPLNLFFSLSQPHYVYPKLKMIESSLKNDRPKVIIIGDSFFWQIKDQKTLMHIFSEDSKFWYYFATTSFPIGDVAGVPLKDINIMNELETADYVILFGSIGTLDHFPFGITNYYYDNASKPTILESVVAKIKNDSKWMLKLNNKAKSDKINIDDLIQNEAKNICRDKKTIQLKAFNNKYVSADGAHDNRVIADQEKGSTWETFSMLQLSENEVAIYSYTDMFLCTELNNKTEINANRPRIGNWETFTLIKLENDYVAFKAANGNYLTMDKKTQKIFANAKSVGEFQKFKLIVL